MTRRQGRKNHIAAMMAMSKKNPMLFLRGLRASTVTITATSTVYFDEPVRVRGESAREREEADKIYDLACKYTEYEDGFFPMEDLDSTAIRPLSFEEVMPAREPIKPRGNYRVIRYNSLGKDYKMDKRRRHEYLKDLRVGKQHKTRSLRQQQLINDEPEDMMPYVFMD